MKLVVLFTALCVVFALATTAVFMLGWSVDERIIERLRQPEKPYVLIRDESYRLNEKDATRIVLSLYTDDRITLDTKQPLWVTPHVQEGIVQETLAKAQSLGITRLVLIDRDTCIEPFYGQIQITVGYFKKRLHYLQCLGESAIPALAFHKYLFHTFIRGEQ